MSAEIEVGFDFSNARSNLVWAIVAMTAYRGTRGWYVTLLADLNTLPYLTLFSVPVAPNATSKVRKGLA